MKSLRELYRIGRGPSSSHTMGPSFAAQEFLARAKGASRFEVELHDSLAATGRGHFTDRAVKDVLGAKRTKIVWIPDFRDVFHPNGMRFRAFAADGGKVAEDYSSEVMRRAHEAIRDLYREAQSLLVNIEFFRGPEASCAVIDPHNSVLPLIRKPLLKRMDLDDLIIFDKRHLLMLGRKGESEMLSDIRRISLTMPDTGEEAYDVLWPAVREGKLEIRFAGGAIPGRRRDYDPLWSTAC